MNGVDLQYRCRFVLRGSRDRVQCAKEIRFSAPRIASTGPIRLRSAFHEHKTRLPRLRQPVLIFAEI